MYLYVNLLFDFYL